MAGYGGYSNDYVPPYYYQQGGNYSEAAQFMNGAANLIELAMRYQQMDEQSKLTQQQINTDRIRALAEKKRLEAEEYRIREILPEEKRSMAARTRGELLAGDRTAYELEELRRTQYQRDQMHVSSLKQIDSVINANTAAAHLSQIEAQFKSMTGLSTWYTNIVGPLADKATKNVEDNRQKRQIFDERHPQIAKDTLRVLADTDTQARFWAAGTTDQINGVFESNIESYRAENPYFDAILGRIAREENSSKPRAWQTLAARVSDRLVTEYKDPTYVSDDVVGAVLLEESKKMLHVGEQKNTIKYFVEPKPGTGAQRSVMRKVFRTKDQALDYLNTAAWGVAKDLRIVEKFETQPTQDFVIVNRKQVLLNELTARDLADVTMKGRSQIMNRVESQAALDASLLDEAVLNVTNKFVTKVATDLAGMNPNEVETRGWDYVTNATEEFKAEKDILIPQYYAELKKRGYTDEAVEKTVDFDTAKKNLRDRKQKTGGYRPMLPHELGR